VQDKKETAIATVHGPIIIKRRYRYCSHCGEYSFPVEVMRLVLLEEGFPGMERELKLLSGLTAKQQESVDSLLAYLRGNAGRLH